MIDVLWRLFRFYVVSTWHILQITWGLSHHLGRQLCIHRHRCPSSGGGQLLNLSDLPWALASLLRRLRFDRRDAHREPIGHRILADLLDLLLALYLGLQ